MCFIILTVVERARVQNATCCELRDKRPLPAHSYIAVQWRRVRGGEKNHPEEISRATYNLSGDAFVALLAVNLSLNFCPVDIAVSSPSERIYKSP